MIPATCCRKIGEQLCERADWQGLIDERGAIPPG